MRVPDSGVYVHISDEDRVWYVCDGLYAVLCVCVDCFVMRGCVVSRRYINVCNRGVVNMYLDYLKFCVMCINGRRQVCCCECYFISTLRDEPTP